MAKELSPTKMIFVKEYLKNGGNATRAYLTVNPGCKDTTAKVMGSRWLTSVAIKEAISCEITKKYDPSVDTRENLLADAHGIGQEARKDGAFGPALKAVEIRAKLKGLFDNQEPEMAGYVNLLQQLNITVTQGQPETPQKVIDIEKKAGDRD